MLVGNDDLLGICTGRGSLPQSPTVTAPPSGGARERRSPCLPLMIRTEDPAVQGFGSAALETKGFARAGRGLQAARDC